MSNAGCTMVRGHTVVIASDKPGNSVTHNDQAVLSASALDHRRAHSPSKWTRSPPWSPSSPQQSQLPPQSQEHPTCKGSPVGGVRTSRRPPRYWRCWQGRSSRPDVRFRWRGRVPADSTSCLQDSRRAAWSDGFLGCSPVDITVGYEPDIQVASCHVAARVR